MKFFFHLNIGRVIGIALFVIALFTYRSYENRPVLGLWSYPFFMIIIISLALLLTALVSVWRASRRKNQHTHLIGSVSTYFDIAILFLGIAYLLAAIDIPINAGRVADLNIFGSITPIAVILEWIAMVLLFLAGVIFIIPRLRGKWKNPMLMVVTIGVIIILCEGVIRIKAIVAPTVQGFPTYTSALWKRYHAKFNKEGFRDVEHSRDKQPGTHRILIVGDSFTFGWGIKHIEDRFGEQLAEKLTVKGGEHWEAINASHEDTHTLDHIEFLKQTLPYKPDVVILLYIFNDIDYLSPVTSRSDLSSVFSLTSICYRNFYLFQEIYFRFRLIKIKFQGGGKTKFDPYEDSTLVTLHLKDISQFVELAEKTGAFVWVVPFDIVVVSEDTRLIRYNEFVNQAVEFGIPVLSLDPEFGGYQLSQLTVNKFDPHPNELAIRIGTEEVANFIMEKINNRGISQ